MRISRQPFSRRDKSLRNETVSRFKIECPYTLDPLSKSRNSPSHYASRFNTWRPFELSGFRGSRTFGKSDSLEVKTNGRRTKRKMSMSMRFVH